MIYWTLFFEFFKIGLFTFGGGYAMIPLVKDLVINNNWMTSEEFYGFLGVCESTPGPVAINMATYVGAMQGDFLGSICATLGVVLPSFIIIVLIASILNKLTDNKYFKMFIRGVKPIVSALILTTGLLLLIQCIGINIEIKNVDININYISIAVFVIVTALYLIVLKVFKKKISSIFLIVLSAALGIVLSVIFV